MSEVVYAVEVRGWIPHVVRSEGRLELVMGIDFNRGYDIREFRFFLTDEHLDVLRGSLARHLILWTVLAPMGERAGRNGTPDESEVGGAIDLVLLGGEQQVEQYVAEHVRPYDVHRLIAHGGDPTLIEQGRLFEALAGRVQVEADWKRVREYRADLARADRGIRLSRMDKAVLRYANRYETWSGIGSRRPEQVSDVMLADVLKVVGAAERATVDLPATASREEWESVVGAELRRSGCELCDESIRAVAWLLRDEAPDRDWAMQRMPSLADAAGDLRLHLYDAAELALIAEATADPAACPRVERVGGELFVGVDRRRTFAKYDAVTESEMVLWHQQQQVTFEQLVATGVGRAELGKHVVRDGKCWIHFADLAAAVLVDAEARASVIDPVHLPNWPDRGTFMPDGELVAAPLSRSNLVMVGSRDEDGMRAILDAAVDAIRRRRGLVSPRPLVWREGQWQAFDWMAEFPGLAERIKSVNEAYDEAWRAEVAG